MGVRRKQVSALCVWYSCPFLLPTTHLPSLLCVQAGITPLSSIAALRHCPTNSCCCPAVLLCFVVTFLQGLCFYSTKSVIPEFATLRTIVQAAGGEVGHRLYVRTYVWRGHAALTAEGVHSLRCLSLPLHLSCSLWRM